jgi:hypothetical protein
MPRPRAANRRLGPSLHGVSCASENACFAVGILTNDQLTEPFTERLSGSYWAVRALGRPRRGSLTTAFNLNVPALAAVSCPSVSRCFAVATLTPEGEPIALAEHWAHSRWSAQPTPERRIPVATGLTSVSCPTPTACTAVGADENVPNNPPLVERWNGARWSIQTTPLTPTATVNGYYDVSCPSVTSCVAVGTLQQPFGSTSFAEEWDGARWRIEEMPSIAGGATNGMTGVSCTSPRACVAVGSFQINGTQHALAEGWDGARWQVQAIPAPGGAAGSSLERVSCISSTSCVAVGTYSLDTSSFLPLVEAWNGASWQIQPTPPPPGTSATLRDVSCPTVNMCVAVGTYNQRQGPSQPLAEIWNGAQWTIDNAPLPPGTTNGLLTSVSCASNSACTVAGTFENTSSSFTDEWNGSTWSVDPPLPLPPRAVLNRVSCTSNGPCTAVGYEIKEFIGTGGSIALALHSQ